MCRQFYVFDQKGLVTSARPTPEEGWGSLARFVRPDAALAEKSLLEVIQKVEPSALIGLTGAGKVRNRKKYKKEYGREYEKKYERE
jgi:hypothetical protein